MSISGAKLQQTTLNTKCVCGNQTNTQKKITPSGDDPLTEFKNEFLFCALSRHTQQQQRYLLRDGEFRKRLSEIGESKRFGLVDDKCKRKNCLVSLEHILKFILQFYLHVTAASSCVVAIRKQIEFVKMRNKRLRNSGRKHF